MPLNTQSEDVVVGMLTELPAVVFVPATGLIMLGLAVARLVAGPGPGMCGPWFAVAIGIAGTGLAAWGFGRLRRLRAACPHRPWRELTRADLAAVGIVAVWLSVWSSLTAEQREEAMRSVRDAFELVHVARGHP